MRVSALVAAVVLCGGCPAQPTTLLVDVKAASGDSAPASLLVSVYDRFGTLSPLDQRIKHPPPGKLVITDLPALEQPIRIVMRGAVTDGLRYGSLVLTTKAHQQVKGAVELGPTIVDADGDFVPDDLDNCPSTVNPDQASESGMAPGNACPGEVQPDLTSPEQPDMTVLEDLATPPVDLFGVDLFGADLLPPPDLKPPQDLAGVVDMKAPVDMKPPPADVLPANPSKCPGSGFILCEDFETGTINTAHWPYVQQDNATVTVSNAKSYRGNYALKVTTVGGAGAPVGRLINETLLSSTTTTVYVRYYVLREDTNLFFATMVEADDASGSPGVQMAFSNQQAGFLYYGGPGNGDHEGTEGSALHKFGANTWTCVEWQIVYGTAGNAALYTWMNDTDVSTADWDSTNGFGIAVPPMDQLFIGLNTDETIASTAWFDEIVVSTTRIGCSK